LTSVRVFFPRFNQAALTQRLRERMTDLNEKLPLLRVVLFGSYARGNYTVASDVDLLVIMETSAPPTERHLAVSRLLRPRPFPVDILVKTPEEVRCALDEGDFFLGEILNHGRVLYERND